MHRREVALREAVSGVRSPSVASINEGSFRALIRRLVMNQIAAGVAQHGIGRCSIASRSTGQDLQDLRTR